MPVSSIELPPTKGRRDENFPIASRLLPKDCAAVVTEAYAFARVCDDIADSPDLATIDKQGRLLGFEQAFSSGEADPDYQRASTLKATFKAHDLNPQYVLDLLAAFKLDIEKNRYQTWEELVDYAMLSTAPAGRIVLDLFGESRHLYPLSDAICVSIQILNHINDAHKDYSLLDRCYLPAEIMLETGAVYDDLAATHSSDGLRAAFDVCLDRVDHYLLAGKAIVEEVSSNALMFELAGLVRICQTWSKLLRRKDPLSEHLYLSKRKQLMAFCQGALSAI